MACERYESRLTDEVLAPGDDAELTSHLGGCAQCRAELARQSELQSRIAGSIAAMVADEPSPALLSRVRLRADAIDAIVAEDSASRALWVGWTISGVAVAALAGFAIFFASRALLRQSGSGPQPVQTAVGTPSPQTSATNSSPQSSAPEARNVLPPAPVSSAAVKRSSAQGGTARRKMPRSTPAPQLSVARTAPAPAALPTAAPGFNVIIPPGQREAVLRLVAAMKTGRVNAAGLLSPSEQQQMTPIEIAPLKITLLDEKKANSQSDGNQQ
ncbi:MAG TPA: hypothetical protein VLV89_05300 [Candidatus Acidoferrum sp.]|nr:hypothetical protein [Candidatus Acidoferrum sp.]